VRETFSRKSHRYTVKLTAPDLKDRTPLGIYHIFDSWHDAPIVKGVPRFDEYLVACGYCRRLNEAVIIIPKPHVELPET
jgi:hypothetical protein